MVRLLALDVGTVESGYCIMDCNTYKPIQFGKVKNEELLEIVRTADYQVCAYEQFKSYGMAIGDSTIESIQWNGRFIQLIADRGILYFPIMRVEEKYAICGSSKAKDSNIRQALIDRFAKFDFKNGKGTKKNPDWFYGFKADVWTSYCVAVTFLDKNKELWNEGF